MAQNLVLLQWELKGLDHALQVANVALFCLNKLVDDVSSEKTGRRPQCLTPSGQFFIHFPQTAYFILTDLADGAADMLLESEAMLFKLLILPLLTLLFSVRPAATWL